MEGAVLLVSDWPGYATGGARGIISTAAWTSCGDGVRAAAQVFTGAAAWPAANRAIYVPFLVHAACVAYQMGVIVGTQSGNLDIGIYDAISYKRLVSSGSTAVAAAGFQAVNITDTTLIPGVYFAALCVDNTTAQLRRSATATYLCGLMGVLQQAVGAVTLPATASSLAQPASGYLPLITISTTSVI